MATIPHLPTECLLANPEACTRYVVWYQCADRCVPPQVIVAPPPGSGVTEAYIYTDTRIFPGLPEIYYKQLRNLGIRRVQIMSYDGHVYEPITSGFVDLAGQRQLTSHSTEEDTTILALLAITAAALIVVAVGNRILR